MNFRIFGSILDFECDARGRILDQFLVQSNWEEHATLDRNLNFFLYFFLFKVSLHTGRRFSSLTLVYDFNKNTSIVCYSNNFNYSEYSFAKC